MKLSQQDVGECAENVALLFAGNLLPERDQKLEELLGRLARAPERAADGPSEQDYRSLVAAADLLADRLRREAARVAEHAQRIAARDAA